YVDMIDVGGADLNFATKGADGTFDLTKGQLKDIFGQATTKPDFADLDDKLQQAQKALTDAGESATDQQKSAVTEAQNKLDDAVKNMTVKDFVDADFSKVSSATMERILKSVQGKVTSATSNVVTAGATLGAAKAQVTGQIDYVSK
ncbi:hypothetical protein H3S84_10740, partial [Bartonella sp. W8098]|nr:hypothetical protein [Bartonella apis]MBI0172764.1 hypothetical protein [Bartonella sp. W8151]